VCVCAREYVDGQLEMCVCVYVRAVCHTPWICGRVGSKYCTAPGGFAAMSHGNNLVDHGYTNRSDGSDDRSRGNWQDDRSRKRGQDDDAVKDADDMRSRSIVLNYLTAVA
jgi:hypothetical protein